jgi:aspartyl-tRNA(Asn)/glutamyl-tRNA(Gln) amidotransferase subunit C
MKSSDLDVRYVARLARLELTAEEATHFQAQLTDVLGYIAALDRLDVAGLEPTLHAEDPHTVTRPDADRPGFTAAEALANAPAAHAGLFLTPRVVE